MDRGKPSSKVHVLPDRRGLPLVVGLSVGNVHDRHGSKSMGAGPQTKHDPYRGLHFHPGNATSTKPMTFLTCGDGSAASRSHPASPARALSRNSVWADTGG